MESPEARRAARERAEKWLAGRGRDGSGLIALWDLTGDEDLLAEAARRFPDDPCVVLAMAGRHQDEPAAALPWIDRFIAAEPGNPHGYFLKAWALMSQKDRPGALAALRASPPDGRRETHVAERAALLHEAAIASGVAAREADRLSLGAPLSAMLVCRMASGVTRAVLEECRELRKAGREDRVLELTGLGLVIANHLANAPCVTLREFNASLSLEANLLTDLSGDTGIGSGDNTVAARFAGIVDRQHYVDSVVTQSGSISDFLNAASDATMAGYVSCFLTGGELAAREWVLDQLPQSIE
jgi:hypothetical protein